MPPDVVVWPPRAGRNRTVRPGALARGDAAARLRRALYDPEAYRPRTRREWVGLALDVVVVAWCIVGIVVPFVLL